MKPGIKSLVLWIVLVGVVPGQVARGCSCVEGEGSIEERLKQYQTVFFGTVVEMRATELGPSPRFPLEMLSVEVTFKLHEAWKGVQPTATTIVVNSDVGMCGFPFEFGKSYLVTATTRDGKLYAHLCSLTKYWEKAGAELLWLRRSSQNTR